MSRKTDILTQIWTNSVRTLKPSGGAYDTSTRKGAFASAMWTTSVRTLTAAPTVALNSLIYDPVAHTLAVNTKFTDETEMDFLTISGSSSAILITGPGGYSQLMSYYSDDVGMNAATINVLWVKSGFPITPGTYTVSMVANQVKDTAGNSVAAQDIGTVRIGANAGQIQNLRRMRIATRQAVIKRLGRRS